MRTGIRFALCVALPALCFGLEGPGQDAAAQNPAPAAQSQPAAQGESKDAEKQQSPAANPAQGAEPSKPAETPARPATADDNTFVIGPEDQIEITVWADNRIGGNFLVRPDGKISMNLLGDVQAADKTPAALSAEIADLLKQKDIIRRPEVNVKVLQVNSKKFSINGEVMKTGSFPLVVPTRVMEALVNAGGFKDFANKKDIVIIRGNQRLKFNWNDVVKGKKTEQNVYLQPGDIIIVK